MPETIYWIVQFEKTYSQMTFFIVSIDPNGVSVYKVIDQADKVYQQSKL